MNVSLVLDSNSAEVAKDVLHLSVGLRSRVATQVVDGLHLRQSEVGNCDDDQGTDGVTPDHDNCDDGGFDRVVLCADENGTGPGVKFIRAAVKPAEDTEQSGKGVDDEDGTNELPVGEGLSTTSNEDQPVLNQ